MINISNQLSQNQEDIIIRADSLAALRVFQVKKCPNCHADRREASQYLP